jgi:hypothetical protein
MAKVEIISVSEKIEGFSIYIRDGKKITRRKGGPSKERIAKDPALAKVRQNASEFGNVSRFAKSIFDTLNIFTKGLRDSQAFFRLMKLSNKLKSFDLKSAPGERTPLTSLAIDQSHKIFSGFEFNVKIPLSLILSCKIKIDEATNTVNANNLSTEYSLRKKVKATDYNIQFARLSIDKITGICSIEYSQKQRLETTPSGTDLEFHFATPYTDQCIRLYLLRGEFNASKNSDIAKSGQAGNVIIIDTRE